MCFFFQTKSHVPTANLSPTSDEYVLNLLSSSEEKLLKLLEELDGTELPAVMKQMEETEVNINAKKCLQMFIVNSH